MTIPGPTHFVGLALEDNLGVYSSRTKDHLGTFSITITDQGDSVLVEGRCEGKVEGVVCGTDLKATVEKIGLQTLQQTHSEYTKVRFKKWRITQQHHSTTKAH